MPTILSQGTKDYSAYVVDQVNQLNTTVKALDAAVQSGNVDAAKTAYAKARPFYERAESSVEGFDPGFAVDDNAGNLDYLIDMRESTPVDAKVGWKGFHAIERDLWQGNAITPPRRHSAPNWSATSASSSASWTPAVQAGGAARASAVDAGDPDVGVRS